MSEHRSRLDEKLGTSLRRLERAGLRRSAYGIRRGEGGRILLDGRAAVDFSSNDYLGLAADPRLATALAEAARAEGSGAAAARLISGTHPLHLMLEEAIARFKGAEAALLFPSGYAANVGAIPALARQGDVIYSDELNHASLIDGARLSRAEVKVFPHCDLDALARMLEEDRGRSGDRWIVVDSVFSMDGDLFPLDRLVRLARRCDAWTYVDDAHGTGVLGATGRGAAEHWGVEGEIDVTMGTLGKAFGTVGAFVAGSATLREWLLNRARAFVFTTAAPPALAAAALEALRIVDAEPERRAHLWANAERLRAGLASRGYESAAGNPGHIVPVVLGGAEETVRVGRELNARGFHVGVVRPPTVPPGSSRLRVSLSAAHSPEQIDALLDALATVLPRRDA